MPDPILIRTRDVPAFLGVPPRTADRILADARAEGVGQFSHGLYSREALRRWAEERDRRN